MKPRLTMSLAIGAGISLLVLLLTAVFPTTPVLYLGAPGYIAIMLAWGPHSSFSVPETVVPVIAFVINTVIYGLIAYWILGWFWAFKRRAGNGGK